MSGGNGFVPDDPARTADYGYFPWEDDTSPDAGDVFEAQQQALDELMDDNPKLAEELVCEAISQSDHLPGMLAALCCAPDQDDLRIGIEVRRVVCAYFENHVSNRVDDILQDMREDEREGL